VKSFSQAISKQGRNQGGAKGAEAPPP